MKYSFRCKNCGHLENSANTAESAVPHACRVCGCGVSFCSKSGVKSFHPENWQDLSSMNSEELAAFGLTVEDVEKHFPKLASVLNREPKQVFVTATETIGSVDKV